MATASKQSCPRCGRRDKSGNCPDAHGDGHPVQCVGDWAVSVKHAYIQRYVDATRAVRQKFLTPKEGRPASGAGFLDLFSGPGRVRNRDTGDVELGSPFIALNHTEAPFTRIVLCDLAPENVAALRARTSSHVHRVQIHEGNANDLIDELIADLPRHGLNFALVDPFSLGPLHFETLVRLSEVPRMDILLNFPTSDIRRNLIDHYSHDDNEILDRALGTRKWRDLIRMTSDVVPVLTELLASQLERYGYTGTLNRTIPVTNRREGELYRLMLFSKHSLADKIWRSVTRNTPGGQRGFGPGFD